ncbi:MAG: GAF domain-containing protein [Chloroflexi bacterium]|nr:GAF domain-containing protein [Chloroflexota bacterium]
MRRQTPSGSGQLGAVLRRMAGAATEDRELVRLVEAVLDQVMAELAARSVSLSLADDASQTLHLARSRALPSDVARRLAEVSFSASVLAARAASSRQVQLVEDVEALPESAPDREVAALTAAGSMLAIPLLASGKTVGVLVATRAQPGGFASAELATLRGLADILAAVIGEACAGERRLRTRVESISHACTAISEALTVFPVDLRSVLQTIAEQARTVASAQYAALGIGTDPAVPFAPWVFSGMPPEVAEAIGHFPRPIATLGAVARTGQVVRVPDVHRHPAFVGFPAHHPAITSFLGVPVRYRGRSVGNLYLGNKLGAEEFTEEDRWAIELLATNAGVALHRARLQFILESAPNSMILVEADTGHLMANPQAGQLFGRALAPEAGPGQLVGQVCYPDGRPLTLEELPSSQVLRGRTVQGEELLVVRPDGGRIPVLASAAPVRVPWAMEHADVVMTFQDVSALKELEQLRQEWTSIVAHDLRQPITLIVGYAGALRRVAERPDRPEQERKAVEHIRAAAGNLNRMIGDLLDASSIEARRLKLERRAVDLPGLVQTVVERMAEITEGHAVRMAIEEDLPCVEADPGRLEQVLGNLLSNAAKYGYPGTEIQVEVVGGDGEVQVSVTNQGPGIAPEELAHIFSRFHRAASAKTRGVGGLGLGLYISKGLVEAHGGRIWAESTPGQTTTFHFTLPSAAQ